MVELDGDQKAADPWHVMSQSSLAEALTSGEDGLTEAEAAERLTRFGLNQLPEVPPPTWRQIAIRQFQSPLIYILAVAALVSVLVQHPQDALFIAAVLLLNATIGGYQEWRA